MQFLLITLGSIGDLLPFLVVAENLHARGHRCVIASNAGYAPLVQASGFGFAAIWERGTQSLDHLIAREPERAWAEVYRQMLLPAAEPTFRCIRHMVHAAPTIVVASWSAFGARRAHAAFGIPLASVYLSPYALSLPDVAEDPGERLGFFPDWFAEPQNGASALGFPFYADSQIPPLPPGLEAFLREGPPPVVMTPGSFMRQAAGFFRAGLAACEEAGRRAVLLTPYADQVPALPAFARHFPYIALQRLLPRAAAIIHHGGIGTAAQGLRAGIPQLLSPVFFDQFDNAKKLESLGVGCRVAPSDDPMAMAATLRILLSADVRDKATALAGRLTSSDAVNAICARLEKLA